MPQYSRQNAIDQLLDIAGSPSQLGTRALTDETSGFGKALTGQTGSAASIVAGAGAGLMRVTGVTGMTQDSVGNFLTISGANSGVNNGTFLIAVYTSATSIDVVNSAAVVPDTNNPAIVWTERRAYSLLDDLDVERSDRQQIKGVNYDQLVNTYLRRDATGTPVPGNLANLTGKTLDAFARCVSRGQFSQPVEVTLAQMYAVGALKHAATVDETGVPVYDTGIFTGDRNSCYVGVVDALTGNELEVLAGPNQGERIFGVTYNGTSTSPDSVEVRWYSCPNGSNIVTSSTVYSWEKGAATAKTGTTTLTVVANVNGTSAITGLTGGGFASPADVGTWITFSGMTNPANNGTFVVVSVQSATAVTVQNHAAISEGPTATILWQQYAKTQPVFVNLTYGYNERLDLLDQNAFRFPLVSGLVGDADLRQDIIDIQQTIGEADGATSLAGLLTNLGTFYAFNNLPDATPSVVEALNTLNTQIGNRTYTGSILTSGQTITASLQALSGAITTAAFVRWIERVVTPGHVANAPITLPGGQIYTLDGTMNGAHLWVWWRGILRDPGSVVNGDDYAETSTTQITPYSKISTNEHITYIVH